MTTVVSTFAGCGGSSLGYKMAGCDVRLAVEWDDNAVATYKANHPATQVWHGDINELKADELFSLIGMAPGELDIFDGSPPCQGFSMAGKRDEGDERNLLFEQYVRLLRELRPKAMIMENVKGMTQGRMRGTFIRCLQELRNSGYQVKARLLNAKWYGVPQSRERVIFIGYRNDLGIEPSHPDPTCYKPITAGEALVGVPKEEVEFLADKGWASMWRQVPPGRSAGHVIEHVTGRNHGFTNVQKLDPNRPSPTVSKVQGGRTGWGTQVHWAEPRPLTVAEAKRLASFPDDYVFIGSYRDRWARIGNSVPPLFMKAIADHVVEALDGRKEEAGRPRRNEAKTASG